MNKPYASTTLLYAMMATPGENKKIREYIESLEERVHGLEVENNINDYGAEKIFANKNLQQLAAGFMRAAIGSKVVLTAYVTEDDKAAGYQWHGIKITEDNNPLKE